MAEEEIKKTRLRTRLERKRLEQQNNQKSFWKSCKIYYDQIPSYFFYFLIFMGISVVYMHI